MFRSVLAGAALAASLVAAPASAELAEEARAPITAFYDALTAAPGKDMAGLITRATASAWVSCGGNEACRTRDEVIAGIAARQKQVPDLKWEIKEVLQAGDRVIVRGEATGHPAGEFLGAPAGGKGFRLMSIDVHTVEGGKLVRSYHVEDWLGAVRQLSTP